MDETLLTHGFENVGAGPDPVRLADLLADVSFLAVFLQRDHYCTNCRDQVKALRNHYDEFEERDAEVVSIVPESRERVVAWQEEYELPFPLLADPETAAGEAADQPVRFGWLGKWSDFIGRQPQILVLADGTRAAGETEVEGVEGSEKRHRVVWEHRGSSTFDRPELYEILSVLDRERSGVVSDQ